jgi:hypothetical protein
MTGFRFDARAALRRARCPLSEEALADACDHFEERAAIREHDGGQPRPEAEAAAMVEAAAAVGLDPEELRSLLDGRRV